jgi:N-acetylated-alpha-linked acidic dipeptidase
LERRDFPAIGQINERILGFERTFIDPEGLPGRRWYRHLVYAPKATYLPEILPGLKTALEEKDHRAFEREAARLAKALRRAAARLGGR